MMSKASIPHMYWDEIFSNAVFLINRLPSSTDSHIPYTTLFSSPPDYSFLKVVGCLCFPHTKAYNTHKLQLRAMPCVFLGYSTAQKGYRCLHVDTNRIFVSRNVKFDEQVFSFAKSKGATNSAVSADNIMSGPPLFEVYLRGIQPLQPNIQPNSQSVAAPADLTIQPTIEEHNTLPQPVTPISRLPARDLNHSAARVVSSDRVITPAAQTSATQSAASPSATAAVHTPTPLSPPPIISAPPPSHPMVTRTRDNTRKPRQFPDHLAFLASVSTEPTCFSQANMHAEWRQAMAKELDALAQNQTWILVPPPINQRVIGSKWVFKIKRHSDGSIERYKARLVAKGYHQQEGIDFTDTFSPVVRPTTIMLVLSLAVTSKWVIRQLDVQNAFLHGDLTETVYMSQPPDFIDASKPDHVCLLSKSIYGLKQSPRAWFSKLSQALLNYGFVASHYDPSLFLAHVHNHIVVVLVYVDDIVITGSDSNIVNSCITHLHANFAIKDLGELHYFLGLAVTTTDQGLQLTQTKYIHDLLLRTNMLDAKPTTTPIATVNKLSQFMHSPTLNQWIAVKRVLRYLSGTIEHGLFIHSNSSLQIHAYTDADWAGSSFDRRSTSGYCIYLGKNLISWSAKKQPTVSRSSTEAEYRSLAITCSDQLADIMTKPLSTSRHQFLRTKLNVIQLPLACGGVLMITLDSSISATIG
ncbi:hypothetical protein LUZ61_009013 [Rhynchospora tenuis]|uniref:Reverse transcriptase Ty1/copia-type domain-containing protein n=1 Tax=Rhynchospora tenuis TaxID=198213 RepID=A0AAD5ZWL5_9POAL|nr:hypothetical protein LUZ61_009013 [Rhynchospora tenuis]